MMKAPIFVAAIAMLMAHTPTNAATTCGRFMFDPHPRLALSDLKRLASTNGVGPEAADGGQMVYWPFDLEDHPVRGKWRALGVVYVTRGDLGEEAVGGMLLQSRSGPAARVDQADEVKGPDGVNLKVRSGRQREHCTAYVSTLDNSGGLFAGGQLVGRLR